MPAAHPHPPITAVILAGGKARRMDGADKALLMLAGRPLLAHIITRLQPQVSRILLNSNRPADNYAQFALPVIADTLADQPGPLAGLLSALLACDGELVLTVPCDTPCLPNDLVARMYAALEDARAEVCSAADSEQLHAAVILARRSVIPALQDYLASGKRKVQDWLHTQKLAVADFSDQPDAFSNVNTPQELHRLEQRVTSHDC